MYNPFIVIVNYNTKTLKINSQIKGMALEDQFKLIHENIITITNDIRNEAFP